MVDARGNSTQPEKWVGGLNPDFDVDAHRGEALFIGRDLEDARFIGHVGGAPACQDTPDRNRRRPFPAIPS